MPLRRLGRYHNLIQSSELCTRSETTEQRHRKIHTGEAIPEQDAPIPPRRGTDTTGLTLDIGLRIRSSTMYIHNYLTSATICQLRHRQQYLCISASTSTLNCVPSGEKPPLTSVSHDACGDRKAAEMRRRSRYPLVPASSAACVPTILSDRNYSGAFALQKQVRPIPQTRFPSYMHTIL